jgi:hypothetical protein
MPTPSNSRGHASSWSSKLSVDDQTGKQWARGADRTRWIPCGWSWDAAAVTPMIWGLQALDGLGLDLLGGYGVLADRLRDTVYVMVPTGTGAPLAEVPGVRVLSSGRHLLVPQTRHGTYCSHWISEPGRTLRLVPPDPLAASLTELACARGKAAVS